MYRVRCSVDPFEELSRIGREVGTRLGERLAGVYPAVNAWGDGERIVLTADLPGVELSDLNITVEKDTVTLKGKRTEETVGESDQYGLREQTAGEFSRTLRLPFEVDTDRVEARLQNGVLRLTLPKPELAKPRKINVQVETESTASE